MGTMHRFVVTDSVRTNGMAEGMMNAIVRRLKVLLNKGRLSLPNYVRGVPIVK